MESLTDLRTKEYKTLQDSAFEKKKDLLDKVLTFKLGKSKAFAKKSLKKDIARIKTILREKEILNAK